MKLDGVTGDARKRVEPTWIAGQEPMYTPQQGCSCSLHRRLVDVVFHGNRDIHTRTNDPSEGDKSDINEAVD